MDTQALKDTLSLACDVASLVDRLIKGFSFAEIGEGLEVLRDAPRAFTEFNQALQEYKALDDAGRADLDSFIQEKFQLTECNLTDIGQKVLEFAVQLSVITNLFVKKS